MYGPESLGHWSRLTAPNTSKKHQFLEAGLNYRVIRSFSDYDGHIHSEGEKWMFLGSAFLPYDDGLSWFVSLDGEREWHIRMQRQVDEQGEILDNLAQYVERESTR